MNIDLHMHTICSDGQYEINDLIEMAISNNLKIISITDHDSIEGLKKIKKNKKIKIINGIELTSRLNKESIHILGYNIDINNSYLNEKLDMIRTNKFYTMMNCLNYLKEKYNIVFNSYDIAKFFNSKGTISRADLAKLCVKYGYASSIDKAFDKYLGDIYNYININEIQITPSEAIKLIHQANGIAILAHPKVIKTDNIEELIKKLKENGLDGIEVYHSLHNQDDVEKYLNIAKKYKLLTTGGSDFHGENKDDIKLDFSIKNKLTTDKITMLKKVDMHE